MSTLLQSDKIDRDLINKYWPPVDFSWRYANSNTLCGSKDCYSAVSFSEAALFIYNAANLDLLRAIQRNSKGVAFYLARFINPDKQFPVSIDYEESLIYIRDPLIDSFLTVEIFSNS